MAKQTINIGAAPNDGTGTPLRTSFDYTNQNFTELYTSLGGGTGLPGAVTQVLFNNGTNVAGDAGMTYNSTTDVLSVGGVTASGNVSVAGTFTARNGDNASSMRASASDYAAVAFDGTTSGTRVTSTLTGQNIGTGDFSVWSRFRVPALATFTSNPATIALGPTNTDGGGNNSCRLVLLSGGSLSFRINDGAGATTSGDIANFSTGYSGQVVDVVVTRTGATLKIYINGSDTAYTGTPAASTSINSIYCQTGIGIGVALFSGRIYRSVVFNRALSASDVTELITTGVNPADQWGTQTQSIGYNPAVLNGGFETNSLNASGTWATVAAGTSTATIDTSGLFSRTGTNAGKLTLDASISYTAFNVATVFAVSKRYRFSFWVRKGAASGVCGVQYGSFSAGAAYGSTNSIGTTYQNVLFETVTSSDGGFTIGRLVSSAALSEIYIDDVEVTRIGAIVDLDFTVGTGYQTYDRSTNNLHGTLFGGVEFMMPRRSAVLYATTNTSGNQQMLGTLAIPTNAIIEDIIVNSTGAATVSVGNASAGTQIVNAAAVVSGRQKLTIATPFSTTGNLWVNSSTTATLQFTIAYTIAL